MPSTLLQTPPLPPLPPPIPDMSVDAVAHDHLQLRPVSAPLP